MKRWWVIGLVVAIVLAGTVIFVPSWRFVVLGTLRNEPFFDGLPISYWRGEVQTWFVRSYREQTWIDKVRDWLPFPRKSRISPTVTIPLAVVLEFLRDDDVEMRKKGILLLSYFVHVNDHGSDAICEVTGIGSAESDVVPHLVECLTDPDEEVRDLVYDTLNTWGSLAKQAVPQLLEAWRLEDPRNHYKVISTLNIVDPEGAPNRPTSMNMAEKLFVE